MRLHLKRSFQSLVLCFGFFVLSTQFLEALEVSVTLNGKPVAAQRIRVVLFENGEARPFKELDTSASGKVVVAIPEPKGKFVAAVTEFEGVSYFANPAPASTARLEILVYKTSTEPDGVFVEDVRLHASESEQGLRIEEEVVIHNSKSTTYTGGLQLQLPKNTFDLQFIQGFREEDTTYEGNTVILKRPLNPGKTRLSFAYGVEPKRGSVEMDIQFNIPIHQLSLSSESLTPTLKGVELKKESSQKLIDDRWSALYSAQLNSKTKTLSLQWSGLSWKIVYLYWMPWLAALILFVLILILRVQGKIGNSPKDRDERLNELFALKQAFGSRLLSDEEYQLQRLQLLEKLIPYYYASPAPASKHSDSAR